MSTSLANAPYASCSFRLTVVPNFRRSAGTSWLAAFKTLIKLNYGKHWFSVGGLWVLRSGKSLVVFREEGDCETVHAGTTSSTDAMNIILNTQSD